MDKSGVTGMNHSRKESKRLVSMCSGVRGSPAVAVARQGFENGQFVDQRGVEHHVGMLLEGKIQRSLPAHTFQR